MVKGDSVYTLLFRSPTVVEVLRIVGLSLLPLVCLQKMLTQLVGGGEGWGIGVKEMKKRDDEGR